MEETANPLPLLDEILSRAIHPAKIKPYPLTGNKITDITFMIYSDGSYALETMKEKVTYSRNPEGMLQVYHQAIVNLMDKAFDIRQSPAFPQAHIERPLQAMDDVLAQMMDWINTNKQYLLTEKLYAPKAQLRETLFLLQTTLDELDGLVLLVSDEEGLSICRAVLQDFAGRILRAEPISLSAQAYHRWLAENLHLLMDKAIADLDTLSWRDHFIAWNLNTADVYTFIETQLDRHLATLADRNGQLVYLNQQYKDLNKPGIAPMQHYRPDQPSVAAYLLRLLKNEIDYLQTRSADQELLPDLSRKARQEIAKVICTLSVDQIGLILRAAYEAGILTARSIDALFKALAPHIATTHKANLSWRSMRNKASAPEQRDKVIAISVLQQVIKIINVT